MPRLRLHHKIEKHETCVYQEKESTPPYSFIEYIQEDYAAQKSVVKVYLIVTGNHNNANASAAAQRDRGLDLLAGRIKHAHHTQEDHVALVLDKLLRLGEVVRVQSLCVLDARESETAQRLIVSVNIGKLLGYIFLKRLHLDDKSECA